MIGSIRLLSSPADEQVTYLDEMDMTIFEMAEDFDDLTLTVFGVCDLTPDQRSAVTELDQKLDEICERDQLSLLTDSALSKASEWADVRARAVYALTLFSTLPH